MSKTRIAWADRVWNVTSGCKKVSEGCKNCYAERMAKRLKGMGIPQYKEVVDSSGWTGKVVANTDLILEAGTWHTPQRVFVDSMADLFYKDPEALPVQFYGALFSTMMLYTQHTFILLTKRPDQMAEVILHTHRYLNNKMTTLFRWPLPNVWLGVSAENQERLTERVPLLLEIEAVKHLVSLEPLLGPVNMNNIQLANGLRLDALSGSRYKSDWSEFHRGTSKIDWVIAGCETGPGRREAQSIWFEDIVSQCEIYETPLFIKQMNHSGTIVELPQLDGKVWKEIPKS